MIEFETFAYLGLQKTGSTFVTDFLKRFTRERCLSEDKHLPVPPDRYSPQKLYIISIRNPVDHYLSLYSYGVGEKGKFQRRLRKEGYDSLYSGTPEKFRRWLKVILKATNARSLNREYARIGDGAIAQIIGFQSFRYLRLSILSHRQILEGISDQATLRQAFEQNNIIGFVLRNEQLNSDLATLVQTKLKNSIADPDAALEYLKTAERINVSNRVDRDSTSFELGKRLERRMRSREWLLHELFGY